MDGLTTTIIGIAPYVEVIKRPVVAVHRLYREYVAFEDLYQEAMVWWYGPGQPHLAKYIDDEADHVLLRRSIWRYVLRYAEREKAHQSGYEPVDQVRYSPREIQLLLPTALNPDGLLGSSGLKDGPTAKGNLAEGGTALAALMDVRRGLDSLAEDDLHFLYLAEDLRHDWEKVVTHLGSEIQPDTARRRHARIVTRIVRFLNGPSYEENAA